MKKAIAGALSFRDDRNLYAFRNLAFLGIVFCALVIFPHSVFSAELRVVSVDASTPGSVSVTLDSPAGAAAKPPAYTLHFDGGGLVAASDVKAMPPAGPASLAICIDKSGSMGQAVEEIKAAVDAFFEQQHPNLSVSVIAFGSATKTVVEFEKTDSTVARERIQKISVEGRDSRTKLYEAVSAALDQLKSRGGSGPKRLLVISDGEDDKSDVGPERIVEKARENGVVIDAIAAGPRAAKASGSLESLADRTGGRFAFSKSGDGSFAAAFEQLVGQIPLPGNTVRVSFVYPPTPDGAKTDHAVLEVAGVGTAPLKVAEGLPVPSKVERTGATDQQSKQQKPSLLKMIFRFPIVITIAALLAGTTLTWLLVLRRKPTPPEPKPPVVVVTPPAPVKEKRRDQTKFVRYTFPPPGPGQPTAVLNGIAGPLGGQRIPIDKPAFRVGAAPENDLVIGGDDFVSGRHATVRFDHGSLYLEDRNSRNGTFLNGTRLAQVPMPLSVGDEIRIGKSAAIVEAGGGAPASPAAEEGSVA